MAKVGTKSIRNIVLLGHGGSGKTSVAEALLFACRSIERLGKTPDGNTVCDYDEEEIKRGFSLSLALANVTWNDIKINILDAPGYLGFAGEAKQGTRVADSAVIVVDGKAGVEVGTELAWDYATEAGIPKSFFINKFDDDEARFNRVFMQLREQFGVAVCPLLIPMIEGDKVIGFIDLIDMRTFVYDKKDGSHSSAPIPEEYAETADRYRNMLYESIAETSEELMDKYFAGEEISRDEAVLAIHEGIIHGDIVPVFCGAATHMWGITALLDTIADSFPRTTAKKAEKTVSAEGEMSEKTIDPEGDTALFVFKTVADPFVGRMSYFKVMNGTLKKDATLKNTTTGESEKLPRIYTMIGKKQTEVEELACGDIGMIPKLAATNTGDTLVSEDESLRYAPIDFPKPQMARAIVPLAKGDEDKISTGIAKLLEEDRTLKYENNAETKQMILYGIGDIHLDVTVARLKRRYGVSVGLVDRKIAYRETIKKRVQVEGKHKKQSGGSGQYGHVKITFSPGEAEGLTFTESVVGGSVPKGFFPAVEKGLEEAMQKGVLAGFPVVHLAADLFDGSYHAVDSNEISFKLAAKLAFKEGLRQANPVLLEPVGALKVTVPEGMVGDVMGDLNKRRGRVLGMNPSEKKKGYTVVEGEAPFAEMADYTIVLRAMTQGRGSFELEFERYEEVPANLAQKIIAEAKADEE